MTKKELQNRYGRIIRVGYCDLQYVCKSYPAFEIGYNSGVYGWNWTAYELRHSDGRTVAICTGYRSLTGENVKGISQFNDKAREVANDWATNYDEKKQAYQKIIDGLIEYIYNA